MLDRYLLAIKRALNKRFKTRNSVNLDIAKLITSYSHRTRFQRGSTFHLNGCMFSKYFIVYDVLSAHYVRGAYVKPFWYKIGVRWHMFPENRERIQTKKIFNPFTTPVIKQRAKKHYRLLRNEQNSVYNHPLQINA